MKESIYPESLTTFQRILDSVGRCVELESRLPAWPFTAPTGYVSACEYDDAIEGPFGPVLRSLADTYGDRQVSLVVLDPSPQYYRDNYGSYPAFSIAVERLVSYWDVVAYEPGDDPTGAVIFTANTVAIVGDSGKWAVWEERWWGIALLLTSFKDGPWTGQEVEFFDAHDALAWFAEPPQSEQLDPEVRRILLSNIQLRGSGPTPSM